MKQRIHLQAFEVVFAILALLGAFTLAGCADSPTKAAAGNPELQAQAIYAEYVIFEETVARIITDPAVPDSAKIGLKNLHAQANPIFEGVHAQWLLIQHLRASSPQDIPDAIIALNQLITQAEPLLRKLKEVR